MAHFSSYPPTRLHGPGTRISQADAQKFVANYLKHAETDPSLHPDSVLTPSGPEFATAGGAPGLVMNQLRRFEAGLRGVNLAAEVEEDDLELGAERTRRKGRGATVLGDDPAAEKGAEERDPLEGMWQDKEEFEREQEDVEGDVGDRAPAVVEEGPTSGSIVPKVNEDAGNVEITAKDKERRKQAKKERRQKDKKDKEAKKAKKREIKREKNSDDGSG
ncbi:hypothetical protein MMC10_000424 [Thelotrema lepadinum]|nr:hypothetical protein [Thelotrema lepadinum]